MGQHADNRELGLRCDDAGPRKMRRRRLRGCLNRKQQNQHCLQYGWFDLECSLFMIPKGEGSFEPFSSLLYYYHIVVSENHCIVITNKLNL